MNNSTFFRVSGAAAMIGALARLAAEFMADTPMYLYGIILIGALVAFIGIYQYQKDTAGLLSLIALLLTFVFYATGRDNFGDIAFPTSFVLLGAAAYQAGKFPRWASAVLFLAAGTGLLDPYLISLPEIFGLISVVLASLAFLVMGYSLWRDAG